MATQFRTITYNHNDDYDDNDDSDVQVQISKLQQIIFQQQKQIDGQQRHILQLTKITRDLLQHPNLHNNVDDHNLDERLISFDLTRDDDDDDDDTREPGPTLDYDDLFDRCHARIHNKDSKESVPDDNIDTPTDKLDDLPPFGPRGVVDGDDGDDVSSLVSPIAENSFLGKELGTSVRLGSFSFPGPSLAEFCKSTHSTIPLDTGEKVQAVSNQFQTQLSVSRLGKFPVGRRSYIFLREREHIIETRHMFLTQFVEAVHHFDQSQAARSILCYIFSRGLIPEQQELGSITNIVFRALVNHPSLTPHISGWIIDVALETYLN